MPRIIKLNGREDDRRVSSNSSKRIIMESSDSRVTPKVRVRVVGGIFRTGDISSGKPLRYAVVRGRRSGIWSFPKGHGKRGETAEETARREIEEETGWTVLPAPIGSRRVASVRYYIYEMPYEMGIMPTDQREIGDARWMTRDELREVTVNRGIAEYLKL